MSVAFLFPGQGAQDPGFLHRLPECAEVASTLREAGAALGCDVGALDAADALASTVAAQLTIVTAGVAVARALAARGAGPDAVAGLSVGAFAAAVAAGALELRDALPLVRLRGELMERAYPRGHGMAAIVGLDERTVSGIVEAARGPGAPLDVANVNAPAQIVIAGADPAIDAALERARAAGARRVERMAVAVPSHSPLLAEVSARLLEAIRCVPMARPRVPYATSRRARLTRDEDVIREDLARNVAEVVRWHDATTALYETGARLLVEMPPGHALSALAAAAFPGARAIAAAETRLDTIVALVRRERALDAGR